MNTRNQDPTSRRPFLLATALLISPPIDSLHLAPPLRSPVMAPASQPMFAKDEKALCFHHELLYEAKVLDVKLVDPNDKKSAYQYKVHYKGWKAT